MSAKCGQCWESVSSEPYDDEKQIASECDGYCGQWLCVECSEAVNGTCSRCREDLTEQ